MDGDGARTIIGMLAEGIKGMIIAAFIAGIVLVLAIGGLIWGGVYLYKNFKVVKKAEVTVVSTNAPARK